MQYTYFAPVKGGKFLIRSIFQYNQKTYSLCSAGYTTFHIITKPTINGLHTNKWIWECKRTHEIKTWYQLRHLVTKTEVLNQRMEAWSPFDEPNFGGLHSEKRPHNLYKVFPEVYQSDMVVNPLTTLGYSGGVCSSEMNWNLRRRTPNTNTDINFVVNELKKRYNVIAYKENIYEYVKNHFLNADVNTLITQGEDAYVKFCTNHIKSSLSFIRLLQKLLESYKIPYDMFNLDEGKYCETFNLEKGIERSLWSDKRFCNLPEKYLPKLKQWTDDFMKNNSSYLMMLEK